MRYTTTDTCNENLQDSELNNNSTDGNNLYHQQLQTDRNNIKTSTIYQNQLIRLKESGQKLRSDFGQPQLLLKPSWFDETLFQNAKSVYQRHFMGVNFAHLSGLLLLVRINSIYCTLSSTGKSESVSKLFRRYYQTLVHVKQWYEGDIFKEDSDAHRSLLIVRGMHNKVSSKLNCPESSSVQLSHSHDETITESIYNSTGQNSALIKAEDNQTDTDGITRVHISEYDLMLTQFAFVGFIVTRAKYVGLIEDFSLKDLESLLHFWRVIGYYLGASEEYNLCSRKLPNVIGLCEAILEVELKKSIRGNNLSSPPGVMGVNIVRSLKFIPMLTMHGMLKYLYELLELDTSELEAESTRYSKLSYTLIKLVLSRLLAYLPFRWFNNQLTRLSIFLVGKSENWFANRLESKYGPTLKI